MPRRIQILPSEYKSPSRARTAEERRMALTNELAHLRAELKRLEGLIRYKDGILIDTAHYFEGILRENKPQSIDQIKRRISILKGAADRERGGLDGWD